jgi:hypothetical protein
VERPSLRLFAPQRKERIVPTILVTTDGPRTGDAAVLLRERILLTDLQSEYFAAQLIERVGWALVDAEAAENTPAEAAQRGSH